MRPPRSSCLHRLLPPCALFSALGGAAVVGGCDDPRASVEITDLRVARLGPEHVLVDVDLRGHEGLGGNVGPYCVRMSFPRFGVPEERERCFVDLEDGDTKTVRFEWLGPFPQDGAIDVRVRLGGLEDRRSVAAPR